LSNTELLALIIRQGDQQENVLDLSRKILNQYSLQSLSTTNVAMLQKIKGIGRAKASQIIACFELARRMQSVKVTKKQINQPKDIALQYMSKVKGLKQEHIFGIYLDTQNQIIKEELLFKGTLDSSVVHAREVFTPAVQNNAAYVIVLHNHPSGNSEPSEADIATTKYLQESGNMLRIELLDHIILGEDSYFSFKEKKII
jgi:DNA repair protein RadC